MARNAAAVWRERRGRRAGWRCARAGDSVVLVVWAARVAARAQAAGGARCQQREARVARIDPEGNANLRGGTSLPPVLGVGPMEAEPLTDAALP